MASFIFLIIMDKNPINSLRIGWSLLITIIDKSYNETLKKLAINIIILNGINNLNKNRPVMRSTIKFPVLSNVKIEVVPLVGPSSILLALMASGMSGQNFAFKGYLPIDTKERTRTIKQLELLVKKTGQTQIFMETPYRNHKLLDTLKAQCNNKTRLCIAANITSTNEFIQTKTIEEWKQTKVDIHKQPAIFLIS